MPERTPPEATIREEVARRLESNRDRIVSDWMRAVIEDDQIPSADQLTMSALRDHFPDLLTELTEAVRLGAREAIGEDDRVLGRAHGKARWKDGYRVDEMLRELARIRGIVLAEVRTGFSATAGADPLEAIGETVRRFFDEIIATSVAEFIRSQDAELLLRIRQMENADEQVQAATAEMRALTKSRLHLLRAVVHELRNSIQPLALGANSLLQENSPLARREAGKRLATNAGHLQALLDRLQQFAELLSGQARSSFERVDLRDVLEQIERRYRPRVEKQGVQFQSNLTLDPPEIISDRARLLEIADNLFSNAIRFTTHGFIHVEITPDEDDFWIFRVSDSGSGIAANDASHIFQAFHSASTDASLRLGLVATRYLARMLGGEITFRSSPGWGSVFEVTLPRTPR